MMAPSPDRRGSLSIDDEGTPSNRTTLIEDGVLVGFMQDRLNARLMGVKPTGNGRRQSYAHAPMPRMTNTYMLSGDRHPDEILKSIKKGLYAKSFGGGQVDITSGKFVFSCTEAYLIEDGKITTPVKGATLIGSGARPSPGFMVGNTWRLIPALAPAAQGQGFLGVGQPTLRIDRLRLAERRLERAPRLVIDMDDVLCTRPGRRLRAIDIRQDAARHKGRHLGFGVRG
jgi:TldD protein